MVNEPGPEVCGVLCAVDEMNMGLRVGVFRCIYVGFVFACRLRHVLYNVNLMIRLAVWENES